MPRTVDVEACDLDRIALLDTLRRLTTMQLREADESQWSAGVLTGVGAFGKNAGEDTGAPLNQLRRFTSSGSTTPGCS